MVPGAPYGAAVQGMIEVRFAPMNRTAWVRGGASLLAAAEAADVEILTGCTRGMCGTDPVRIVAGAEALAPPKEHELGTLERMGIGPGHRLACSAELVVPAAGGSEPPALEVEVGQI